MDYGYLEQTTTNQWVYSQPEQNAGDHVERMTRDKNNRKDTDYIFPVTSLPVQHSPRPHSRALSSLGEDAVGQNDVQTLANPLKNRSKDQNIQLQGTAIVRIGAVVGHP